MLSKPVKFSVTGMLYCKNPKRKIQCRTHPAPIRPLPTFNFKFPVFATGLTYRFYRNYKKGKKNSH